MIRQNQSLFNFLNGASDILLTFASYALAMFFRFEVFNGQRGEDMLSGPYLAVAAVYSFAIVFLYYCLGLYTSRRFKQPGSDVVAVMAVNAVGVLGLMAVLYITRLMDFPRLAVALFWFFSSLSVGAKRVIAHSVLRYYRRRGYNKKSVVVVGNGRLAEHYIRSIADNPEMGFCIEGYVSAVARPALGACLGGYDQLGEVLRRTAPDELVVALEPYESQFMKSVLQAADKEGVRISIIPFYNEYIPAHPTIDIVGDTKLINMRATPLDSIGWAAIKRGMDIVGSLLLLTLFSPVMLATAIGVKLSSPGPVLFKQERVGLNKKPFYMYKFRSMRVTDTDKTAWTTDADPRKTRFGSFIRKFSIDELPQFFNVLIGDMSLVGPRPEIPYHVDHFKEEIPLYLVRQQIRPGITGWAQVNGLRGDTSIEERVKYDIWYIENWSLELDIRILARTALGGMINSEKPPAPPPAAPEEGTANG